MRSRAFFGLVTSLVIFSIGCDSSDEAPGDATGGSGTGGSSNASGASGTSGSGGAGNTGGSSGASGTSGNASGSSGVSGAGGNASGSSGVGGEAGAPDACSDPALVWRTANKTNYTSYPDPGSEECIEYNGCMWAGQFAACNGVKSEEWVAAHDIVAAFPSFDELELHDLCLRQGSKTMVVTVLDTCGDADCDGCCTENQGSAEQLIDLESYTNARWGVPDGAIEWADLGPTSGDGCD
jgi:hypothetical protein